MHAGSDSKSSGVLVHSLKPAATSSSSSLLSDQDQEQEARVKNTRAQAFR